MPNGSCCRGPAIKTIRVGTIEVGIMGLEEIFAEAVASSCSDDDALKKTLVLLARKCGNYISPSREELYASALLREYRHSLTIRGEKR